PNRFGIIPSQGLGPYSRRPLDRSVRTRVGPSSPAVRAVDDDRVGVAKCVMHGRHQLDSKPRSLEIAGARIVGLDRDLLAAGLDADAGPSDRLVRLESVIDQVDEDLRLQLRLALAAHRPEDRPWTAAASRHRRDQGVLGALLRLD